MKPLFSGFFFAIIAMMNSFNVSRADEISLAVASNFTECMRSLAREFEKNGNHKLSISTGATGRQFAQISHGAPFDIFFAADTRRPQLLEQQGLIIKNTRFTYAIGKLILWSPEPDFIDDNALILTSDKFSHLSVANPKLAPYGLAARQVLSNMNLWDKLQGKMVRGENVGQAFQFVKTGNAQLGFVAASQVKSLKNQATGSKWIPDKSLYDPIRQQAVLLKDKPAARQFLQFMKSPAARAIITGFGYGVDDAS